MKSKIRKILIAAVLQFLFAATLFAQKYENGTKLLKGAEVLSATPLQLDYVLENLSDTAKITVNLHEGKTHLVLNDGSGQWREWWYHEGRWKVKIQDALPETDPTVAQHIKDITQTDIESWNNSIDNNHAHSNKSVLDDITSSKTTNWDASYDWGNHAAQGYLKSYTLPEATISALGGIKVGDGLNVKADGTVSTTANDVVYGKFTPTIDGGIGVTYHLTGNSFGYYVRNNRVVCMEIFFRVESISGTPTTQSIMVNIPPELRPSTITSAAICPIISILHHQNMTKEGEGYTFIGGHYVYAYDAVSFVQYKGNDSGLGVSDLYVGSSIRFSVTYISL